MPALRNAVIDIKTFMLVLAIGNVAFAMLMAGYARSGSSDTAMGMWKWAKLVQGFAHLLGFLRADSAQVWLAVAANTLLVLGIMLEAAAYCTFFGLRNWQRILYPATLLGLAGYHAARLNGASPNELTVMMSVILALLSGAMTVAVLRPPKGATALHLIIVVNNAIFFIALSLRAYAGIAYGGLSVFSPSLVQTFTYVSGYLLMIVNGFGFLLLCKEADDRKMARLATTDSLTGLANRRAFFDRTDSARMLAARTRQPVALMMLDLDHFKSLNDRYGHAAGDDALCLFAATAQTTLREHDIMGRLGGEEFALLLPGTDLEGALQAAERLRLAVQGTPLPSAFEAYAMTVSIGVVAIEPHEHINAALARADHALYAAKNAGRNRVERGAPAAPLVSEVRRCA